MSHQLSRRSVLRIAAVASFMAAWFVAGCSPKMEVDPTIKTESGKTVEESIRGQVGKAGPRTPAAPTQRVKGGPD
jgi:hypothetical protein